MRRYGFNGGVWKSNRALSVFGPPLGGLFETGSHKVARQGSRFIGTLPGDGCFWFLDFAVDTFRCFSHLVWPYSVSRVTARTPEGCYREDVRQVERSKN